MKESKIKGQTQGLPLQPIIVIRRRGGPCVRPLKFQSKGAANSSPWSGTALKK